MFKFETITNSKDIKESHKADELKRACMHCADFHSFIKQYNTDSLEHRYCFGRKPADKEKEFVTSFYNDSRHFFDKDAVISDVIEITQSARESNIHRCQDSGYWTRFTPSN